MKKFLTLALAALMMVSMFAVTASAAETNLLDDSAWTAKNDGGQAVLAFVRENNAWTLKSSADGHSDWAHFVQTVTGLKANTTYVFKMSVTLTAGGMRLDVGSNELPCLYAHQEAEYGETVTFTHELTTGADQTSLEIHVRNNGPAGCGQAIGTINSMTLVEKGAETSDDNADTGSVVPAMITVAFIAVAGVVAASKKRH